LKGIVIKSDKDAYVEKMMKAKEIADQAKAINKEAQLKRDTNPMPSYYKNWDNIDVEMISKQIDNDEAIGFDKTMNGRGKDI